jgi:hypothetical protein
MPAKSHKGKGGGGDGRQNGKKAKELPFRYASEAYDGAEGDGDRSHLLYLPSSAILVLRLRHRSCDLG